jgi:hypothetical protein
MIGLHPDKNRRRNGYAICGCGNEFDTSEGHEWCATCNDGNGPGANHDPEHAHQGAQALECYINAVGRYPNVTETATQLIDLVADIIHHHVSCWPTTNPQQRLTPEAFLNQALKAFYSDT